MSGESMPPIITLTTDFGVGSRYVAAMKGVLLHINPAVNLVDVTHAIPPQDIAAGAHALAETAPFFPPETIHVAVVDPGVGTRRKIVYARLGEHHFVVPDNGLLARLADRWPPTKIIDINRDRFWRQPVSATFHGRDIIAPVAAHLSLGTPPDELGAPIDCLTPLAGPEVTKVANQIDGQVVEVDSFGNLVTNITREMLSGTPTDESVTVTCDEHETQGIFDTYAEQPAMTFIALFGSSDRLELAIVEESAAAMLGISAGTPVRVAW